MTSTTATEVSENVWKVECTLPGHSIGHLNSYVIKDGEAVAVVDLPWFSQEIIDSYEQSLAEIGINISQVQSVFLTHYHEDHAGAAAWMQRKSGATIYISAEDLKTMDSRYTNAGKGFEEALSSWLAEFGTDADLSEFAIKQFHDLKRYGENLLENVTALTGERVVAVGEKKIRAIPTPGHTAGHYSYFEETAQILFSGDHIFTWGTANATTRPVAAKLPFSEHAGSSKKLLALSPKKVFPGHGKPIEDFSGRISQFNEQTMARRAEILELCDEPSSVWDISAKGSYGRTWEDFSPNSQLSILGETHAHILELEREGALKKLDVDPVIWFQSSITQTNETIKEGIKN